MFTVFLTGQREFNFLDKSFYTGVKSQQQHAALFTQHDRFVTMETYLSDLYNNVSLFI